MSFNLQLQLLQKQKLVMSLKRKTKVQHCTSSKVQVLKQINYDLSIGVTKQVQNENDSQVKLLQRMQEKVSKILNAYQKLDEQNKMKNQVIKQLEKENFMLKQRLVEKSDLGESRFSRTSRLSHSRKQPQEAHVLQRTFTPVDIKREEKNVNPNEQNPIQPYNLTSDIVQQHNTRIPSTKMLKESRSIESLTKLKDPIKQSSQPSEISNTQQLNEDQNKLFSIRDSGRAFRQSLDQDNSFLDVLTKLREKIKVFDEQDVEDSKNSQQKVNEQPLVADNKQQALSELKSSQNFTRKSATFKDPRQTEQMQALKHIWNQRDEEIKKMDHLFSKIDQRLETVEK